MNILGISGQERDAAAALVRDGQVVAAIEEEKLDRIRHIGMNYAGGLPFRAIEFCLERAQISFDKIDYVAYYLEPHRRFHREIAFNSSRAINAAERARSKDSRLISSKASTTSNSGSGRGVWSNRGSHKREFLEVPIISRMEPALFLHRASSTLP